MSDDVRTHQLVTSSNRTLIHTEIGFDFLLDPSDYITGLLARDGIFEVAETDLVSRIVRANDTCIDAGCHIGYYSCLLARLVGSKGRVYAFDANPEACQAARRNLVLNGEYSAEVIHTALCDRDGTATFYISTDDQTGLSSLGPIPNRKATVSVPCMRLDTFLTKEGAEHIRLLKVDVEGAEELVLRGAGQFISDHAIDYVLLECFDDRLQLLDTSTERVAGLLMASGYTAWEYGTQKPFCWSQAAEVRSRGDCNYLFTSLKADLPAFSLAPALYAILANRDQLIKDCDELRGGNSSLLASLGKIQNELEKKQNDIDWLLH